MSPSEAGRCRRSPARTRSRQAPGHDARSRAQQRRAEHVRAERARNRVHGDAGQPLEILGDPMGNEMDLAAAARQISRQPVIGAVHPAERREVAGRHEPGPHAPSAPWRDATPCSAPARNQY